MAANPPADTPGDRPPPGGRRPSFLRSWFGWLLPRPRQPADPPGDTDAYFAAVGSGREALPPPAGEAAGPPVVLGPSRSGKLSSPLAAAYARPAAPVAPAPKSQPPAGARWQVLEPPNRADPVPHEEWRLARRAPWTLLGASVRGKLHAHQGMWRDDAFDWGWAGDWTCVAVADGAGSAPLSRVGARLACAEGVRSLTEALADWRPGPGDVPAQKDLRHLRAQLASAARRAQAAIAAEAQRRRCPARDFHTTCLLLVHAPFGDADLVGALQVGDGAIGLSTARGTCTVLGDADHGAYSSETRFLTTPRIEEEFERRTAFAVPRGLRGIAVLTDGVADDFFPEGQRLAELFDGDPIADLRAAQGGPIRGVFGGLADDPRDGRALAEWLRYEKRGSSDDRTLVLLYRGQGGSA